MPSGVRSLFLKTAILAAILEVVFSPSAQAACPHPLPAPNSEFFKASSVIVGVVVSEETELNPYDTSLTEGWFYRLRIERTFRGSHQKLITVYTENTNGRFPLRVGEEYLLFIYRVEGRLTIDGCGNSAPLSEAGPAIRSIEGIKDAGPYGEIEGRVQVALGGDGVPGIRIVAHTGKLSFSTISARDGWFQMRIPPGKYKLSAVSRKFAVVLSDAALSPDDPEHFLVHRGSTTHFEYIASQK